MKQRTFQTGARTLLAGLLLVAALVPATAAITPFSSRSGFDAATAGLTQQLTDFESEPAGTSYAAGTGPAGAGFTLSSSAPDTLLVADLFWTSSGTHYLGLDNPDTQFLSGDSLTFSFSAPVSAFGLYVIGGADLQAGDVRLSAGGADAFNGASPAIVDAASGSYVYFIGLVSSAGSFGSATLTGLPPAGSDFFLIAVDDVLLAHPVPEPSALALLSAGLLGLGWARRRRMP